MCAGLFHVFWVSGATRSGGAVKVTMEPVKGGASQELMCDVLLVCIGRRPYTAKLGLEVRVLINTEVGGAAVHLLQGRRLVEVGGLLYT